MAVSQHGPNAETYEASAPGEGNGTSALGGDRGPSGWSGEARKAARVRRRPSRKLTERISPRFSLDTRAIRSYLTK